MTWQTEPPDWCGRGPGGVGETQAIDPLAGGGGEDLAGTLGEGHDHAAASCHLFQRLGCFLAMNHAGEKAPVVVGDVEILSPQSEVGLDGGGGTQRQDLEVTGYVLAWNRRRESIADDVIESVDLVTEDPAVGAEDVAVAETAIGKGPVVWAVDRESARSAPGAVAEAGVDSLRTVDPEGAGSGPVHLRRFP